jgi:protein involved in polysaccharide export with SLBB domain
MQKIIAIITLFFVCGYSAAQGWYGKDLSNINAKELTMAQREEVLKMARNQGLNDADLEAYARSKGVNLSDLNKAKKNTETDIVLDKDTAVKNRKEVKENIIQSTISIYGSELFEKGFSGFTPSTILNPPIGYLLGPNDKISIRIFGLQEQRMEATIAPNGSIIIPFGGRISISGLTINEAEAAIKSKLSKFGFASLMTGESQLKINIVELRSIQITIWGAKQSGTYLIPSTSTAFYALFTAGGPGVNRTFRNIQIIRGGKVIREVDLYEFLNRGLKTSDINLHENDIIFIPFYSKRVRIRGEVKNPAVYELLGDENLEQAIQYAGGLTEIAYKGNVEIMRYGNLQKEVFTVAASEVSKFKLTGSEVITINAITDKYANRVKVEGAIERPGYYSIANVSNLKSLIDLAGGLKPSAIKGIVVIQHNPKDGKKRYDAYRLDSILNSKMIVELFENDIVFINDSIDISNKDDVFVFGDVNKQGSFSYGENLTLSKLLFLAGGFNKYALYNKILISRKVQDEVILSTVQVINAKNDFWNSPEINSFVLQPGDVVTVSRNPYYRDQVYVNCEGEFKIPGVYPLSSRKQTLFDLYQLAGGVSLFGSIHDCFIIRERKINRNEYSNEKLKSKMLNELYSDDEEKVNNGISELKNTNLFDTIVLGNKRQAFEELAKNFYLLPGDRFVIPTVETTVRIVGNVYNPNVLMYDKNLKCKNYLDLAGGVTENAVKSKVFIIYQNGSSSKTKKYLGLFKLYPKIKPGCQIIVPSKLNKNDNRNEMTNQEKMAMYSIFSTSVTTMIFLLVQIIK